MASCTQTIQNMIASSQLLLQPQIYPNTAVNVTVTQTAPQILILQSTSTQTATFSLSGQSSAGAGSPVNLLLTIYSYQNGVATSIGYVNIVTANSSFQKDFGSGTYIFCISTQNIAGYNGTIVGTFKGYPTIASMAVSGSMSSSLSVTFYQPPPVHQSCNQTIWYSVVDGSLPPGIILIENGILEGTLPNLDCVNDQNPYSPAVNWFYNQNGSISPVGRQWRFKVKAWLENFPDVIAYQWFCIRIYNDWSLDRDNFIAQPKQKTATIMKIVDPAPLPNMCPPCDVGVTPLPVFEPIPELCPSCEVPDGTVVTATSITLPVEVPLILNQRGPSDLDTLFLEWGTIINQENPLFTEPQTGEIMEVTIVFHPTT